MFFIGYHFAVNCLLTLAANVSVRSSEYKNLFQHFNKTSFFLLRSFEPRPKITIS